jgi:hypothetical protein
VLGFLFCICGLGHQEAADEDLKADLFKAYRKVWGLQQQLVQRARRLLLQLHGVCYSCARVLSAEICEVL